MRYAANFIEMYRNTASVQYLLGMVAPFEIKVWGDSDKEIAFFFGWLEPAKVYRTVLDFINEGWLGSPLSLKLVELYTRGEYFESYEPINGWFKKEVKETS